MITLHNKINLAIGELQIYISRSNTPQNLDFALVLSSSVPVRE
jgi:hypothetical protein